LRLGGGLGLRGGLRLGGGLCGCGGCLLPCVYESADGEGHHAACR